MNKSKLFLIVTFVIVILLYASAQVNASSKYQRGDCITPTTKTYSWFGEIAEVVAFSKIDGFTDKKSYILVFPAYLSNAAIFDQVIEDHTMKISNHLCSRAFK